MYVSVYMDVWCGMYMCVFSISAEESFVARARARVLAPNYRTMRQEAAALFTRASAPRFFVYKLNEKELIVQISFDRPTRHIASTKQHSSTLLPHPTPHNTVRSSDVCDKTTHNHPEYQRLVRAVPNTHIKNESVRRFRHAVRRRSGRPERNG